MAGSTVRHALERPHQSSRGPFPDESSCCSITARCSAEPPKPPSSRLRDVTSLKSSPNVIPDMMIKGAIPCIHEGPMYAARSRWAAHHLVAHSWPKR